MPRVQSNPENPFDRHVLHHEPGLAPRAALTVGADASRNVLTQNHSPDIGFDFTVNPYRGCYHGCAYCYARPTHEQLGLGAGTDFERKLTVKPQAPALLRKAFLSPRWKGDLVLFSGVTDCYQPLEAEHRLTRGCLEVCWAFRNPVGIVTKAPLVERDLDLLASLHQVTHLSVSISIPVWDPDRARAVEPYVALPERRMRTVERLAAAGLDVGINVAPFLPGLTEHDLDTLLHRAADAGATRAWTTMLRLPGSVKEVFASRLRERLPLTAEKTLARIRDARGGGLNDPRFHSRFRGTGPYADSVARMFRGLVKKHGLDGPPRARPVQPTPFRRPQAQLSLL